MTGRQIKAALCLKHDEHFRKAYLQPALEQGLIEMTSPRKRNTLEKIYLALRDLEPRIELPEELRKRALLPLERMLALG